VEGETILQITGPGVMALVGLDEHDTEGNIQEECCKKLLVAKMWVNDNGRQRR